MKLRPAILYNKRIPIMSLMMDGTEVVEIGKVGNEKYWPLRFYNGVDLKNLNDWLGKRIMKKNREGVVDVEKEFPKFANYGCMFSLSDQYWFKFEEGQTWDDLNFFTNSYSEDVGKMFFSPWEVDPQLVGSPSPDLTTNGVLKKCWRRENGKNYLYKAGSDRLQQQPISEVLASILLKKLNFIPFVEYELALNGLKLCSKCESFIDEDTEYVPASHLYFLEPVKKGVSVYDHLVKMANKLGFYGTEDYLDAMIAADKIIGNDDRHLGNFGFIRNVETAEIVDFAPLFDSGSSFFGKEEKKPTNKKAIFKDKEIECMESVIKKYDLSVVQDHEQMFNLIDKYPSISWSEKQAIKQRILKSAENLKMLTKAIMEEDNSIEETPILLVAKKEA